MIARVKIADMLTRYSRGIDRCDIDTLLSVFWPGRDLRLRLGRE